MFIQRACLLLLNSVIAKFFGVLELPGIVAVKVELVIDEVMKAESCDEGGGGSATESISFLEDLD